MSAGSDAALIGFKALLSSKGESLTFRTGTLTAHVDRQPERAVRQGRIDFNPRDASIIELLIDAVASTPESGEEFTDEFGHRHRVQTVKRGPYAYRCECGVSEVIPEPE